MPGKGELPIVIVEPVPIADTFATGVYPPEKIGDCIRITWYSDRRVGSGRNTKIERVIVRRIVFSVDGYTEALCQYKDEISKAVLAGACGSLKN